jgi:hypothetical protein
MVPMDDANEELSYAALRARLSSDLDLPDDMTPAAREALLEELIDVSRTLTQEIVLAAYASGPTRRREVTVDHVKTGAGNLLARPVRSGEAQLAEAAAEHRLAADAANRRLSVWGTACITLGSADMLLAPLVHDTGALVVGLVGLGIQAAGLIVLNRRRS